MRKKPPDRTQGLRNARRALRSELRAIKETATEPGESLATDPGAMTESEQRHFRFSPREIANARRIASEAESWARHNRDAFAFMRSRAAAEVAADRRVSVAALVHDTRRIDFTDSAGQSTKINNSIAPALARLLVAEVPGLAEHVELRRCALDEIMGEEYDV